VSEFNQDEGTRTLSLPDAHCQYVVFQKMAR